MTNKTITLSRELVEAMRKTCKIPERRWNELYAALADPVPPAGARISLADHKMGQAAYLEHIEALKAELTKARECIDHVMGLLRADKSSHAQHAIILYQGVPSNEFNQSAAADKGGEL